jgi:hypothetical protein
MSRLGLAEISPPYKARPPKVPRTRAWLEDEIARAAPTPILLIASGKGVKGEIRFNASYAAAGGATTSLWTLPAASHTNAIAECRADYRRRVATFFRTNLR